MHDDQHGTAIISGAALLNALTLVKKSIGDVNIVVMGAGGAAIACAKFYLSLGAKHIVMLNSKGVVRTDNTPQDADRYQFATSKDLNQLQDAVVGADVFVGLSVADVLTPEMLLSMAEAPIVFALANPNPEIDYNLAIKTRSDVVIATGRSDYPNQVNNVLGFPYIFRGALDVRASTINEEMKMAAALALSALAKEDVPKFVLEATGRTELAFGPAYFIPSIFDPRLITKVSIAVAKAAMDSGVAKFPIQDWQAYEAKLVALVKH